MKTTPVRRSIATLTVALGVLMPLTTQAQKPDGDDLAKRFAAADKNGDGQLTLDEAKAGMPRVAKAFDRIDKDKKGYVTLEQINALMAGR